MLDFDIFDSRQRLMEKRTKIIISVFLVLLIGLPFLFFIELARGFGSSEGDYYKIKNTLLNIANISIDSNSTQQLKFTHQKDTSSEMALLVKFELEYYSFKKFSGSGLYAAHAPGLKGSKEFIESIKLYLINKKDNQKYNASTYIKLPSRLKLQLIEKNEASYYKFDISDSSIEQVYLFEDLPDLKYRFNATKGNLFNWQLEQTPLLFFIKKEVADTISDSSKWNLQIKMNDGRIIDCWSR